ncbi:MAG: hypothetical protein D6E12_15565 [Desulfovibrio sp.]|nr:MAG: hypothetical protein D6E12_15565 [Desulfovibrio sp.]
MFFSRNRAPLIRSGKPGEQFLRFVLLITLFVGVAWLFWITTGKSMEDIKSRSDIWDQTDTLDWDTKKKLRAYVNILHDELGLSLKVHIRTEPFEVPELDRKTIFVALYPEGRKVTIIFPSYINFEEWLHDYLTTDHFAFYIEEGSWFEKDVWAAELDQALLLILEELDCPIPELETPSQ